MEMREIIVSGQAVLGIELGSTRIKAVLIGPDHAPIASGDHAWENRYENGVWTYHMEDVWAGLQDAYAKLCSDVEAKCGEKLTRVAAMGFSAMMHGYIPLDAGGALLSPFRTWRNTITAQAAEALTERFQFNIPQRWSIAHLYQAILNGEEHVKDIAYLTTLAGYVHYQLTGRRVLGVGEASGMFPIDSTACDYDQEMIDSFDALVAEKGYPWKLRDILPQVLPAGADAGSLTPEGAKLLDPTGVLQPGCPVAPPEGDAGTGMAATNAVMVHCNNCTNEINAWAKVFQGFLEALGQKADMNAVFTAMFTSAAKGAADGGGLLLYNYLSGEPITGLEEGRPLLCRAPEAELSFPNLMRAQLLSAMATLKIGLDILAEEQVTVDRLLGHGGFFKTPKVSQSILAAAAGAPVSVMETAGEGGPWGMALLAAYRVNRSEGESLEDYLAQKVFAGAPVSTLAPEQTDVDGFASFMSRYRRGLDVERSAVACV